jgi:AraC family transcriptional regulator
MLLFPQVEAAAGWSGLPMALMGLPGEAEAYGLCIEEPLLAMAWQGHGQRTYRSGCASRDLRSSPAMFELYEAGMEIDHAVWRGQAGQVISLRLPVDRVDRLLRARGSGLRLRTRHELFDPQVSTLMQLLWAQARQGGPAGPLYAEGLTLALLGLLVDGHGVARPADRACAARLSAADRVRVRDHVEAHLGRALSIESLAGLLDMSPAHFARAFKGSFGRPPHAWVNGRRMAVALRVLRLEPDRPLAELAHELGFSSQSHFTAAFRAETGTTPARWRNGR